MTAAPVFRAAVPVASVTCPSWCNVSQQEHLDGLFDSEGLVLHWSSHLTTKGGEVWVSSTTYADGTPVEGEAARVGFLTSFSAWDEGMPTDAAQDLAQAILAAKSLLEV